MNIPLTFPGLPSGGCELLFGLQCGIAGEEMGVDTAVRCSSSEHTVQVLSVTCPEYLKYAFPMGACLGNKEHHGSLTEVLLRVHIAYVMLGKMYKQPFFTQPLHHLPFISPPPCRPSLPPLPRHDPRHLPSLSSPRIFTPLLPLLTCVRSWHATSHLGSVGRSCTRPL